MINVSTRAFASTVTLGMLWFGLPDVTVRFHSSKLKQWQIMCHICWQQRIISTLASNGRMTQVRLTSCSPFPVSWNTPVFWEVSRWDLRALFPIPTCWHPARIRWRLNCSSSSSSVVLMSSSGEIPAGHSPSTSNRLLQELVPLALARRDPDVTATGAFQHSGRRGDV